jgi:Ni/Co efflux regulator RcnB
MRLLIAAFAASVLAISLAPAQTQIAQIQVKEGAPAAAPTKTPQPETSGGAPRNPEPHIYKLGEHLSEAYGDYEIVDNWQREQLMMPPEGHHWVRYGENFLLVTATDGLIKRILQA